MDLSSISTDELTDMRASVRSRKLYSLSDLMRDELDSRGSFCIDTKDDQIVYHLGKGYTREYLLKNIKDIDNKFKLNR